MGEFFSRRVGHNDGLVAAKPIMLSPAEVFRVSFRVFRVAPQRMKSYNALRLTPSIQAPNKSVPYEQAKEKL
jgi:hypothetical protein